ncbi:unnamed protein product [Vitrella brassicaformis CCMP3155]|uniref:Homeobox domain-containing protein n=1 Tax=Vitrella brassicaformis (strain CCMP3155) TaxID=1169540 RepID=A0A0G4EJV3_VITBC|nr:unnamed protein product [Vitrella brassicaformis CCMP3155]|eukprot:CEL96673.1 unnamed protein product [Vitrella brassicaformis CCMP3155]
MEGEEGGSDFQSKFDSLVRSSPVEAAKAIVNIIERVRQQRQEQTGNDGAPDAAQYDDSLLGQVSASLAALCINGATNMSPPPPAVPIPNLGQEEQETAQQPPKPHHKVPLLPFLSLPSLSAAAGPSGSPFGSPLVATSSCPGGTGSKTERGSSTAREGVSSKLAQRRPIVTVQITKDHPVGSTDRIGSKASPAPPSSPYLPVSPFLSEGCASPLHPWKTNKRADTYVDEGNSRRLPRAATAVLRQWFDEHEEHPYPTDDEKQSLMKQTGLTKKQLQDWFVNIRKRTWTPSRTPEELLRSRGMVKCAHYKRVRAPKSPNTLTVPVPSCKPPPLSPSSTLSPSPSDRRPARRTATTPLTLEPPPPIMTLGGVSRSLSPRVSGGHGHGDEGFGGGGSDGSGDESDGSGSGEASDEQDIKRRRRGSSLRAPSVPPPYTRGDGQPSVRTATLDTKGVLPLIGRRVDGVARYASFPQDSYFVASQAAASLCGHRQEQDEGITHDIGSVEYDRVNSFDESVFPGALPFANSLSDPLDLTTDDAQDILPPPLCHPSLSAAPHGDLYGFDGDPLLQPGPLLGDLFDEAGMSGDMGNVGVKRERHTDVHGPAAATGGSKRLGSVASEGTSLYGMETDDALLGQLSPASGVQLGDPPELDEWLSVA